MQMNVESCADYYQMNQISALNNPEEGAVPLI